MFKRHSVIAKGLSVIAFTIIWLLSSAIAATGQEPQQGAINTTRSNIKNTSRTGVSRLDPLILRLKKASGGTIATRQLADLNIDGELSDAEGAFDFGALAAGDYVLTLSRQGQVITGGSNLKVARIGITGAVGGTVEKEWSFETNNASDAGPAETQRVRGLGTQMNGLDGKLDNGVSQLNDRTNASTLSGITFKADGRTTIGGKITLLNGGIVIQNIGKSN